MRILLVEDERKVALALREGLEAERFDVVVESTGQGAFLRTAADVFDVILLDLNLPDRDGLEILAAMRNRRVTTPVVILTARDGVEERVRGLEAGADDYLVKPFAFAELLARMRALGRRKRAHDVAAMSAGPVVLDVLRRTATRGGEPIELTPREFDVLHYLMRHRGQVVSREALSRDIWKEPGGRSATLDNVIDVHVMRLRRKVDPDTSARLIHTIRGVGFMLSEGEG
jgi:DNA-binding response OmpR family regulator